jgi:hypothetical protein
MLCDMSRRAPPLPRRPTFFAAFSEMAGVMGTQAENSDKAGVRSAFTNGMDIVLSDRV